MSAEQQELLAILAGELQAQLETSLAGNAGEKEQLAHTALVLDNFANAAELIGLTGLANAWRCLRTNFEAFDKAQPTADQQVLIDSWIIYFLDLLQQLMEGAVSDDTVNALVIFLGNDQWPFPLPGDDAENLRAQLQSSRVIPADNSANQLPLVASAEMLILVPGEQINADLFEGLMIELPGQVAQFSQYLNDFVRCGNAELLAAAQRIAHTLKGAGNVVGISGLANFMHFSEDLLEEVARHKEPLTNPLQQLLLDMGDTLAAMLDNLVEGTQGDIADQLNILQRLLDAYHAIRGAELTAYAPIVPVQVPLSIAQGSLSDQDSCKGFERD
jgi:chemosensory pili system protein ChpA (sensor histidine kinase/response regulator)